MRLPLNKHSIVESVIRTTTCSPTNECGTLEVVAICFDVIIDADLRLDPFGVFVPCRRQWLHRWPIDCFERLGATAGKLLERAAIEIDDELGDRGVEFTQ